MDQNTRDRLNRLFGVLEGYMQNHDEQIAILEKGQKALDDQLKMVKANSTGYKQRMTEVYEEFLAAL